MHPRGHRRVALGATTTVYLAVLAALTLLPKPAPDDALGAVHELARWLASHGVPVTFLGLEAVGNVLLFVPFGILVGLLLGHRRWRALPLGAATSAAIETTQLLFLPTRFPTLQDWVLNTLGTALGLAALALVARRRRDDEGRAPSQDPAPSR